MDPRPSSNSESLRSSPGRPMALSPSSSPPRSRPASPPWAFRPPTLSPSSSALHSRRRSSGHIYTSKKKQLQTYFIVLVGLATIIFLAAYHDDLAVVTGSLKRSEVGAERAERPVPKNEDEHPMDAFVKGFPKIRNAEERGLSTGKRANHAASFFDWPRTTKMFVFGDSYSTLDMDYRKNGANHGGHHEQLHHKAIDMKWSDYLYAVFHDFHVLQYYNYARPGAVIDAEIIPPGLETYGTLQTQLDEFGELFTPLPGPAKVNWHSDDSLFVVFFGINDMGRMNREDLGRKDIKNTSKALAKSLVDSCRRLHKLGAESILIMNLPPLDVSPKYNLPHETGVDSHELIGRSVVEYNRALAQEIAKWKDELEAETDGQKENRAKIMLFDLESFWSLVMRYPEAFGMTECARYEMYVDQKRPNKGRMGYCYHDNQHISWSSAELIARTVNGFLHRHSISFQENNATETALYA